MNDKGLTKQADFSRRKTAFGAEIGSLSAVVNPERKEACRNDLHLYLTTYFPNSTGLRPFGEDQVRAILRIQSCILQGGRYAQAFPRGFAKTSISEGAAMWATSFGHRKFVPIFGATDTLAGSNLESIKREFQENELLAEDFPEICFPIAALEGRPQRCSSQTCDGESTYITWTADKIVFPTVAGSICSGSIITAHGLTSASRGMKHKRVDGTQQRPDFVLIDDPQTNESANSPMQVGKRLEIIKKSILKMAGQRSSIACVVNGTVIQEDDLMDILLNVKREPSWQSERIKMVKSWAECHETLWKEKYAAIRTSFDPATVDDQKRAHREANEFYIAHREEMDRGGKVCWEWCYIEEDGNSQQVPELSALQHAYNMLIDDGEDVFQSECQNEPLPKIQLDTDDVTVDSVLGKLNNLDSQVIPATCSHLTAFIDVQQKLLYWMVIAWEENFTGYIVDYGAYPDPKKEWFDLKSVRKSLQTVAGVGSLEASIYAGLETVVGNLCGKEWKRDDGSILRIGRLMIDANWGDSTDTVYQFARQSSFASIVMPSHGKYVGAAGSPLTQYTKKPGERVGLNWIETSKAKRGIRYALIDTNAWKSFLQERLRSPMGSKGCLSINGKEKNRHKLLAHHLTAEYRVRVEAKNRVVDEWKLRPDKPDNHWLDCAVGCCVGASMLGCNLMKDKIVVKKRETRKSRVSYLDL